MGGSGDELGGDTRGKLLALLCRADRTSAELASELGISANGVRGHLIRLEAEGLVEHRVVRRGVGKPAHEYFLTAGGSVRLSRAYLPLLACVLSVVRERGGTEEEESLLREAGRALGEVRASRGGDLRSRVEAAVALITELGGNGSVSEEDDALSIRGGCCMLRALVVEHPLVCKAVEAMLTAFLGVPVREACERQVGPSCRLVIMAAGAGRAAADGSRD